MTSKVLIIGLISLLPTLATAQNTTITSFAKAKKILLKDIYTDYHKTIYCNAVYNPKDKSIISYPDGFDDTILSTRAKRIEYEHIVPAQNFGRTFKEWREGSPLCINNKGESYKGRKCAEKASILYNFMQSDMYNLYPAIGSVNGLRSNLAYTELPENIPNAFGGCAFKIADKRAEPPEEVKGIVARATLYFEEAYKPRFKINDRQRKIMQKWHADHPVTEWECIRTYRIENIQFSENKIVKDACISAGLWPN